MKEPRRQEDFIAPNGLTFAVFMEADGGQLWWYGVCPLCGRAPREKGPALLEEALELHLRDDRAPGHLTPKLTP